MAPISKVIIATLAILAAPGLCAPVPAASNGLALRQLAGEGAAADAILSDTDDGIGYGSENAEDNLANNISQLKGMSGGTAPGIKRQINKTGAGANNLLTAAGSPQGGAYVQQTADNFDTTGTDGAANLGTDAGNTEEGLLEDAGSAVP